MNDKIITQMWMRSPLCISREAFVRSLEDCTLDPVYQNGELTILFVVKGPEFHFATFGRAKATKEILDKYPGSLIEKYGYATTRTPKHDTRQQFFNERIGFVRTGEDQHDVHYRIERLRTAKEEICPF